MEVSDTGDPSQNDRGMSCGDLHRAHPPGTLQKELEAIRIALAVRWCWGWFETI